MVLLRISSFILREVLISANAKVVVTALNIEYKSS